MPQSLAAMYVHTIFSTKMRSPFLSDEEFRSEMHRYIGGVTKTLKCPPFVIGGVEDHVHALVTLDRTISLADWVKEVKRVSSIFGKDRQQDFAWQSGYAAFSVGQEGLDRVASYVLHQEEHHRKVSFQDELRSLLAEHNVKWDETYIWD
jgi:putative transposase